MFRSKFHDFWHRTPSNLQTNARWIGFAIKLCTHYFRWICCYFSFTWLKIVPVKISLLLARKPTKIANQPKVIWFCPQTFRISFSKSVWSCLRSKKNFMSKFHDYFRHKNFESWLSYKSTQDDLVLHPKLPHIILVHLLLFVINTLVKCPGPNFITFALKVYRSRNQPRWLGFAPNSSPHHFWCICCCFPSIRLKNVLVKISWLLTWKPAKVSNQAKMTWICLKTSQHSFLGRFVVVWH